METGVGRSAALRMHVRGTGSSQTQKKLRGRGKHEEGRHRNMESPGGFGLSQV